MEFNDIVDFEVPVRRIPPRQPRYQSCWYRINGRRHKFRSTWEARFAWRLDNTGLEWKYEPYEFTFEGEGYPNRYKPDFSVEHPSGRTYYEVKGYFDQNSKLKLQRMRKHHPHIRLVLVDESWFKHDRTPVPERMPFDKYAPIRC
jgi:hypothetical protein